MQTYRHAVAGDTVTVHVPQTREDFTRFSSWLARANRRGPVALDTETSGLDIYSPGYRLRTVQFGDERDAWVIHWERGPAFQSAARAALRRVDRFQIHNAPFDWAVLDEHAGAPLEVLAPRTTDTRLKAGLLDPRQPQEGGIGTGLKPLSAHYVDPSAPDTQGDLTQIFRSLGLTTATGWAGIPLDHPTYNLYAGLDVILTARLDPILTRELDRLGVRPELVQYEHEIARICTHMQRAGMVVDESYVQELRANLTYEEQHYADVARRYGVENVNSTRTLAEALVGMGERLTERTGSGALKVDKAVLSALADLSLQGERLNGRTPNPLAEAVIRSKRAGKWRASYADTFLEVMDAGGRCHPFVHSMAARTGRMSVTRPALQTLPSSDQMIRRALLADPGHVMISCDFSAVEMRVLAALADVRRMREGFLAGEDIHWFTARLVRGAGATESDRKVMKGAGFSKVYGGGVRTAARQTGASEEAMARAFAEYDRLYPEIKRASRRWQREAYESGMVFVSATGRRLPLDRDRTYAVVNYACQSVARDCLGQALLNIEEAGLLDMLKLPIHDEALLSAPREDAADAARAVEKAMTFDLYGVPITAEAEIGGRSWGSLYGADY
ncbi:DNA polymerase [Streptomyces catenulae]|uniref:DNA polymerase I n=1 Tax=Streptomyces catenulae TaxID=66875 RepID=A0ABV2Z8U0_9ACTN|nr:DNA polymerase [Streptomyces catenulae]